MEKNAKTANVALGLCVSGFIIPVLIYALGVIFTQTNKQVITQMCFLLFASFQLGAMVTGMASWRHKNGKIAVLLPFFTLTFIILWSTIRVEPKSHGPENFPLHETSKIESSSSSSAIESSIPSSNDESSSSEPDETNTLDEKEE